MESNFRCLLCNGNMLRSTLLLSHIHDHHNVANVLAERLIMKCAKLPPNEIKDAIKVFETQTSTNPTVKEEAQAIDLTEFPEPDSRMSMDSGFSQLSGTNTPVRPITSCSFIQTTTAHQPSDILMSPPQQQPLPHGIVAWNTTSPSIVQQPMNTAHNQNMMMNQQQQWQNHPNLNTPNSNTQYNYTIGESSSIQGNPPLRLAQNLTVRRKEEWFSAEKSPKKSKKYLSHPTRTGELGDIHYLSSHPACVARANKEEIDQYKDDENLPEGWKSIYVASSKRFRYLDPTSSYVFKSKIAVYKYLEGTNSEEALEKFSNCMSASSKRLAGIL